MKGISAVIATILMLMITIALAGMAYTYISGVFTAKTGKIIELVFAECIKSDGTYNATIGIRNDGTSDVGTGELSFYIDGISKTCDAISVPSGKTSTTTCNNAISASGTHKIRILGPGNVATGTVYCV